MKTILLILIMVVAFVIPVDAEPLDTYQSSWHLIRETADEDGDRFSNVYDLTGESETVPGGNFAGKDSSTVLAGGPFRIPTLSDTRSEGYTPGSKWMFAICGKNYNALDDTFSYSVIGWGKTNGMLQVLAEGTGILGTQAVKVYPDGGDAIGELISETAVTYDHVGAAQSTYFTVTNESFAGAVPFMIAYVTGTNITTGFYTVGICTDSNNIQIAVTASDDNTDSTVQINPAFWADTIVLDATTKWPLDVDGDGANAQVYNSADNEVAVIVLDTTGIEWLQFVICGADAATGEEAGDITVYGRRY